MTLVDAIRQIVQAHRARGMSEDEAYALHMRPQDVASAMLDADEQLLAIRQQRLDRLESELVDRERIVTDRERGGS